MLSGRSTIVAALSPWNVEYVLAVCRSRLGLADDGTTMELWHGADRVPEDESVRSFPGRKPTGEITEYQLILTQ
eukprot:4349302-Amphidinium_carterae.1